MTKACIRLNADIDEGYGERLLMTAASTGHSYRNLKIGEFIKFGYSGIYRENGFTEFAAEKK